MYVLSPTFFKNSNTVDNRLQHDFQSFAWELHAPTLMFFSWAPDVCVCVCLSVCLCVSVPL